MRLCAAAALLATLGSAVRPRLPLIWFTHGRQEGRTTNETGECDYTKTQLLKTALTIERFSEVMSNTTYPLVISMGNVVGTEAFGAHPEATADLALEAAAIMGTKATLVRAAELEAGFGKGRDAHPSLGTMLGANIRYKGQPVFARYHIERFLIDNTKRKIAFIGCHDNFAEESLRPFRLGGFTFEPLVSTVNDVVAALQATEAPDVIVLLTHLSTDRTLEGLSEDIDYIITTGNNSLLPRYTQAPGAVAAADSSDAAKSLIPTFKIDSSPSDAVSYLEVTQVRSLQGDERWGFLRGDTEFGQDEWNPATRSWKRTDHLPSRAATAIALKLQDERWPQAESLGVPAAKLKTNLLSSTATALEDLSTTTGLLHALYPYALLDVAGHIGEEDVDIAFVGGSGLAHCGSALNVDRRVITSRMIDESFGNGATIAAFDIRGSELLDHIAVITDSTVMTAGFYYIDEGHQGYKLCASSSATATAEGECSTLDLNSSYRVLTSIITLLQDPLLRSQARNVRYIDLTDYELMTDYIISRAAESVHLSPSISTTDLDSPTHRRDSVWLDVVHAGWTFDNRSTIVQVMGFSAGPVIPGPFQLEWRTDKLWESQVMDIDVISPLSWLHTDIFVARDSRKIDVRLVSNNLPGGAVAKSTTLIGKGTSGSKSLLGFSVTALVLLASVLL